jgi:hypothetical protein
MKDFPKDIKELEQLQKEIEVHKQLAIQKSLESKDANEIMKAYSYFANLDKQTDKNIKSYVFDPFATANAMGYRDKTVFLSYDTLRQMSDMYVIRAIIETYKDKGARFCSFTDNEQNEGWTIRKKRRPFMDEKDMEMSKSDKRQARDIAEFIQNAGTLNNKWSRDDFETFFRKTTHDSFTFDVMTYEIVRSRKGYSDMARFGKSAGIVEYFATDGATYRLADVGSQYKDGGIKGEKINGYFPSYVQIYQNQIVSEFYPWELCFGIRNQRSDIKLNGYGRSELEDLVRIVTWMLNSDDYNGKVFSNASLPKGILKVAGNVSQPMLDQFRQAWYNQVVGVGNAWKIPIIQSEKMDWVDLQAKNTDMQFHLFSQYLRLIACALFKIDPIEIGFRNEGEGNSIFERGKDKQYDKSSEKGFEPYMKFWAKRFDKMVVSELTDEFEFVFTGLAPDDEEKILESDIKKVGSFEQLNEVRKRRGLEDLEDGDVVLNPQYLQYKQMKAMGSPESNQAIDEYTGDSSGNAYAGESDNPFENLTKSVQDRINNYTETLIEASRELNQ